MDGTPEARKLVRVTLLCGFLAALVPPKQVNAQAITSYFVPADQSNHVYYIGANQHVTHRWFNGRGWFTEDLGITAATGSGLSSYFIDVDNSSHVYYIAANQHVEQLYFNVSVRATRVDREIRSC